MPRSDHEEHVTLSVLDRLLDYKLDEPSEQPASRLKSLRDFKRAVRRDLEWLLNTRRVATGLPASLKEVGSSLAAFGLPDFAAVGVDESDRDEMRATIEEAISTFEPRLRDVLVTVEAGREAERSLRFRIDALLVVDPEPERVTFDTTLELVSGEYTVDEK